jgi:glucosamine-6-phosphate deaminase
MRLYIHDTPETLGRAAAAEAASLLRDAIAARGRARLVLSTGASQFETLAALVREAVDWSRVEMFHLDEYVGLPEDHPASFRRYLRERFLSHVSVRVAHLIDGEGDEARWAATLAELNAAISAEPVDVALIGIGENAHVAFNDPPADFTAEEPYRIVRLSLETKRQQVREGWFPDVGSVPDRAISMTVPQILKSGAIVSAVPHAAKAEAVHRVLTAETPTPMVPATALLPHPRWSLHLDRASAAALGHDVLDRYGKP